MGNAHVKPHPKPRNKKQVRWKAADRPSPPGKATLVVENDSAPDIIHICWPKPVKDGGSTITAYLVEHKRVGTPHWVKSSPLPVLNNELVLNGLEPGWRYQFRVLAENAVGHSDPSEISEPFTVSLQRSSITAPKFTQELKDIVVLEDSKVEFEVHFLGQPAPSICWFKDGFEIFSGNRTRITTVADTSILAILRSTPADEGEIKCTATNKAGHTSTKAKFTLEAPPMIRLPKSYQDQDGILFEIGETIRLNVTVNGRPTPLVFWCHDGESMQNDDRHEIEYTDKTATIKIENALRSDRGEYQIRAVNKLGQDQASFLVTITDKPTPPGKARVILTSGRSVTLSWSIPDDDGGCRVGNYIIEYYRVGWNVWLKAATSRQLTTVLGDLIEGSQYKFRIKAESPYGVSDPSEETDVVFIPDHKRGINDVDTMKQMNSQTPSPFDNFRNRRANSSPRVSFALNQDVPVRPERKKTGKTPEASPRLRRRKFSTPIIKTNSSSAIHFEEFSSKLPILPLPDTKPVQKTHSTSNGNTSHKDPPTSPLIKQMSINLPELKIAEAPLKLIKNNYRETPSPEIIVTDESISVSSPTQNSQKKSHERIPPAEIVRSDVSTNQNIDKIDDQRDKGSNSHLVKERTPSPKADNTMRPPLTHQNFSGSSEFMLVLCPEGEQGTKFRKFNISFDENSLPPPLSLSAPELGVEPPEQLFLRRSASSTELLTYRLMERLNEAEFEEEERIRSVTREQGDRRLSLDIPAIQVNSQPTNELVGLESQLSPNRRYSSGGILSPQMQWSPRKQSLKGATEFGLDISDSVNRKFKEEQSVPKGELAEFKNVSTGKSNEWDYEESISSEEESESSEDGRRMNSNPPPKKYDYEEDEETYNPRSRMLTAIKKDNEKPFEILTVRKEPPDSSIIPKPILKKKSPQFITEKRNSPSNKNPSAQNDSIYQRRRSNSLVDSSDDPRIFSSIESDGDSGYQSNYLVGSRNEAIDAHQIKSPNTKRRSFSLIPTQANFIKDGLKGKNKNDISAPRSAKTDNSWKISALANSTSIAGAGVVISDNLVDKKDTEEEAKVVVDFYGDIVKSYGGKSKPIAEFSRSIISKYDTYEERNLSEIKSPGSPGNQRRIFDNIQDNREKSTKTISSPQIAKNEPLQQGSAEYSANQPKFKTALNLNRIEKVMSNKTEPPPMPDYRRNLVTSHTSPLRDTSPQTKNNLKTDRSSSPNKTNFSKKFSSRYSPEKSHSRSSSIVRGRRTPRSRDASTSPVRFENWDNRSLRNSLERDFYDRGSLNSSRASSRGSLSPCRPRLREITTQTSFRIDPKSPIDITKDNELTSKAEERVKGLFEYFTDLAMVSVASYFYLFQNEYYAIPVLIILVYRQLNEKLSHMGQAIDRRIPNWIKKRLYRSKKET